MNKDIINSKTLEYLGRVGTAIFRGDLDVAQKAAGTLLVLLRLQARDAVRDVVQAKSKLRAAERDLKMLEAAGAYFPLGERRVMALEDKLTEAEVVLEDRGEEIVAVLDLWQAMGASLADLCNLCSRDYAQVLEQIKSEPVDLEFSSLIFAYNLDYKDPRNRAWIDFDVDAPLTHAVKEYFLEQMRNTLEGRAASHRALKECFPGIMDGATLDGGGDNLWRRDSDPLPQRSMP